MLPVACVGLFDALLITAVAVGWFEVPLRGSLLGLVAATLVLLLGTQGLGLLCSTSRFQFRYEPGAGREVAARSRSIRCRAWKCRRAGCRLFLEFCFNGCWASHRPPGRWRVRP